MQKKTFCVVKITIFAAIKLSNSMKTKLFTPILCLIAYLGCIPSVAFADTPIEDGVYYISSTMYDGYVGLGTYHNVTPYIYYVRDGLDKTDDAYWEITYTDNGYTIRNEATNQMIIYINDRYSTYYKYLTLAATSQGDGSEFWNIIEGDDGAYCVQSVANPSYYWNLRKDGTNLLGGYESTNSGGAENERFLFHKKSDTPEQPEEEEHEYVDLGLPSGTLWATCNIGASSPEEYGDYFAWGETTPKKSNGTWGDYSWGTYKWMNPGMADWTQINKYTFADNQTEACWYDSNGTFIGDGQTVLLSEDDAATANWGSEWQMPSVEQMKELINSENTTSTWTTMNGVNGRLITSNRNNASIFLPAGGRRNGTEPLFEGSNGFYWPNVTDKVYSDRACMLTLDANSVSVLGSMDRYCGQSVRPVRVEKKTDNKFPADQYTPFAFPEALHVYLSDGRLEAYPMFLLSGYTEQNGQLVIETTLGETYTYSLSEVDSVSSRRPDDFPTFESFKFNNKFNDQLFTDANGVMEGDTVSVTITAIGKRLTPSFKVTGENVNVYAGGELQESKVSRLRFDKDVYYVVAWEGSTIMDASGAMVPYGRCVRVHVDWLTDRAEVPTIYINTDDGESITSKEYYKDATITIDGHGIFPSMDETAVQIKGRGNSSWGWPKKPYRLKFETKQKPLGMTKGKSWVLLSNCQVGSLMSNAIGMKAANLIGAAAPNHIVPVDLYINGEYRGSYNFTEKVGFSNNSVDILDETTAALLEFDTYYDEPEGQKFRSNPYNLPINIKEPVFSEGITELTLEDISSHFNRFMSALYRGKDISRYVDIEQLVRFMMVNELTLNYEFYHPKSTFCYHENFLEDTCKYVFGPVWDLDWCFGYERNRSYFTSEATSNYWTDMPSMEAVSFIQDLRFKYEPLNEEYRKQWEAFMENGLQELLEYCQDYYDFAHNSFDANKERTMLYDYHSYYDKTDYALQAQQAASWLETRAKQIYNDIVAGVRPKTSEPTNNIFFDNNKLYTLSCPRGDLILSYDCAGLEAGQVAWWTVYDHEKQFAILNIEGNNYLYSPYLNKFLKTGTKSNGEWVDELGSPIYFDDSKPYSDLYQYMITTLTESNTTLWFNNSSKTFVIDSWSTADEGNRWWIAEAGDFDPTEAIEMASQSFYTVTNRYLWEGEVIGTETLKAAKGATPPAPSSYWDNAFVELIEQDNMPSQIKEDVTIDYDILWYGPFYFSSGDTDIHWYDMTIRSDYYVCKWKDEPYYPTTQADGLTLFSDEYLWAFGGNPYQVVLYNRATGLSESLTDVGEYPAMRPGKYYWDLLPNGGSKGFVLRKPGTTQTCINQIGPGGLLKFWDNEESPTDNGSTFRIHESIVDHINLPQTPETTERPIYIYNVVGQRLSKMQKGINIVGGKKVLVK